jgi:enterochelin esterase-like enzyme
VAQEPERRERPEIRSFEAQTVPASTNVSAVGKTPKDAGSGANLRLAMEELTWTFQDETLGRLDVVVVLPDRKADERFPLLVALHGRGEAMKGPVRGARGWVDDYALLRAMARLNAPPLNARDFEGFVMQERLKTLNRALEQKPYEGLVVLCPYTPDVLSGDKPFESAKPFARFLSEVLLPRARRELPVVGTMESTGIDGVSLGGRVSVLSGLYAPEQYHTVAGLQAAFDSIDAPVLGQMGDAALRRNGKLMFRFLTSERDYFLDANQAIWLEFERRHHPVRLRVVPGPHDYAFNRGPGAIEMLFFHDRALRRPGWPE